MKSTITFIICLAFGSSVLAQSAADKAEKRLADLLAPGGGTAPATTAVRQRAGKSVEAIDLPIKPFAGLPIPLPISPRKEAKPVAPAEGAPLVAYQDKSPLPKSVALPTQPLIRVPSRDMHAPLAIPILAQPAKDRASLAEPAFEASLGAAMKRFAPVRDKPVPFTPLNLPDPFEFMRYGELRNPPSEDATPPVMPLTKPK